MEEVPVEKSGKSPRKQEAYVDPRWKMHHASSKSGFIHFGTCWSNVFTLGLGKLPDDVLFGWQACNVITRVLGSNIRFWWFVLVFFFDSQCKGRPYRHLTFNPQSQIPVWYPHRFMKPNTQTKWGLYISTIYNQNLKRIETVFYKFFRRRVIIFPSLLHPFNGSWKMDYYIHRSSQRIMKLSECHANCETLPVSKRFVTSRADEREMTGKYWPIQTHPSVTMSFQFSEIGELIYNHVKSHIRWSSQKSTEMTPEHPRSSKMSILLFILSSCFIHSNTPSGNHSGQ